MLFYNTSKQYADTYSRHNTHTYTHNTHTDKRLLFSILHNFETYENVKIPFVDDEPLPNLNKYLDLLNKRILHQDVIYNFDKLKLYNWLITRINNRVHK